MATAYLKALHIIFVVTWFAGLFYIGRLFVYNTEANDKPEATKQALQEQFRVMIKRLWFGITWPSAILTLIFGISVLFSGGWYTIVFKPEGRWLLLKLILVILLYGYHFSLHRIYSRQAKGHFDYNSMQLRGWNEVPTVFLIAIVFLVVVKSGISLLWGLGGLILFILLLMSAIRVYKKLRGEK